MIEIKIAKTNKEFIDRYQDYLLKNEIELQLFILNLTNSELLLEKNKFRGGVYIDNKLSILFLNAYPFNFQIKVIDELSLDSFDELTKYIIDNNITIKGVQGSLLDCQQFVNSYNLIKEELFKVELGMDILALTKVNDITVKGHIRTPIQKDLGTLEAIINEFSIEAMHSIMPIELVKERALLSLNNIHSYFFVNNNGETTSFLKASQYISKGARIGQVYTFKPYRNCGYAKSLVYLTCVELLKSFEFITLFVDKSNPISNKVYSDVGFKKVIDNYDFIIIRKED